MIGACKKIVRLILMSNISRRKFLKGAGVAALAVAAAGVLAGCSGNTDSKPVVPPVKNPTKEEMILAAIDPEGKLTQTHVMDEDAFLLGVSYIGGKQKGDMTDYYMDLAMTQKKVVDDKTYIVRSAGVFELPAEDFNASKLAEQFASYKVSPDVTAVDIVIKEVEGIVYYTVMPLAVY